MDMHLLCTLARSDILGSVIGVSLAVTLFISFLVLRFIARRRYPQSALDILTSGDRVIAMCGGLVGVRVPQAYQSIAQSGGLTLIPRNTRGIGVFLSASMIEHGVEAHDPVKAFLESWAVANDGEVSTSNGVPIAHAIKEVDTNGQEFKAYLWMVARELTVVSIIVEVNTREARESAVKSVLRDIPKIIDGLRARVHRHTLAIQSRGEIGYSEFDNDAIAVSKIDSRDQAFLEKWQSKCESILKQYLAEPRLDRITATELDWALLLWQRDPADDKVEAAELAQACGVAFGNHCARTLELRWAVVNLDGVRHLVLRHVPSRLLVFPIRVLEAEPPLDDRYSSLFAVISAYIEMKTAAAVS
jgi:hypothetical protein